MGQRSVSSSPPSETSRRWSTVQRWPALPLGHTSQVLVLDNTIKRLEKIMTAIDSLTITKDQIFQASWIKNPNVFTEKWNNNKFRLYQVYKEVRSTLDAMRLPTVLSKHEHTRLTRLFPDAEISVIAPSNSKHSRGYKINPDEVKNLIVQMVPKSPLKRDILEK